MEIYAKYVIYFLIYSILGWCMEVLISLYTKKRFVNRGFLIGPYCPIYGWGVLTIIFLVDANDDILAIFLKAVCICSILEYFTSFFMEKAFKIRWWDYSQKRFNINGRICLETMVPFGVLACLVLKLLHPKIVALIDKLPSNTVIILAIIIIIVFIIDNIISTSILRKIKDKIAEERKDNTEKVNKYVKKWIEKNSYLFRRVHDSFPKLQVYLKNQTEKIKKYSRKGK